MEIKLFLIELLLFKLVIWAAFDLIWYGVCEIKSPHSFKMDLHIEPCIHFVKFMKMYV